ncbi:hypothetical protein [Rhodococcus sp. BS-15]|uniref:hypothetical protein n=1 Tax=Rhodococcus sp. BS-15 TaxID=1304954 RepID=UPI0035B55192
MATRADDSHETPLDTSKAVHPGDHSASGDLAPITTPDSDGHSAPDPEFVPEPQANSSSDIAHTRTAALWTGLVVGAVVLVILLVFIVQNLTPSPCRSSPGSSICHWASACCWPRSQAHW